jgi:hypothetical protein
MYCEHCGQGAQFIEGQQGQTIQQMNCANCGRPYEDQPGGENVTPSEMIVRNMPQAGSGEMGSQTDDPGGNPLMEGILGETWKPMGQRDESYASYKESDYYTNRGAKLSP